jgi:ATP phosphoribosyltransferase
VGAWDRRVAVRRRPELATARPVRTGRSVFTPQRRTLAPLTNPNVLRIALPNKGRLADETRELFADAGLEVRSSGDRALTASLGGVFDAIFVRSQDVAEFVADGAADAGVTGRDLVSESERELDTLLDLEFGRCRLVVAARDDSGITTLEQIIPSARGVPRVATVFPRLTRRFFAAAQRPVEIVPVSGAAEVAPHLGIADIVVDLTSTGSTLKVNGLREIATVLESTAQLIAAPRATSALRPEQHVALHELVTALSSVLRARGQRYLMANVPRAALDHVKQVIPGLNGPTVIDILDGGSVVAVHAVVPSASIYRTIAALKGIGATGILVTRIERLMP